MARIKVEENIQYDDERKVYYVTLSKGKDITGKRVRQTKTFASKREAVKYRNEQKKESDSADWQAAPSNITLENYIEYFFENFMTNRVETTLYGYKQMWTNHIKPVLGPISMSKITPQNIAKYYTLVSKTKNLSSNTVRKHHDFLAMVFGKAVKEGVIKASPVANVDAPKVEKKEVVAYTAEQLVILIKASKETKIYVAVMLAAHLGLRRGEICGLKWEKVDLENRNLIIDETMTQAGSKVIIKSVKTKKSNRKLYINDELCEVLKKEKERQQDAINSGIGFQDYGYVFCWEDGMPYRPNYLSDRFTFMIEKEQLPTITLHGLRHTWVSLGIDEGVPTYIISRDAGHAARSITDQIYAHRLRDVDKRPTTAVLTALERARNAEKS